MLSATLCSVNRNCMNEKYVVGVECIDAIDAHSVASVGQAVSLADGLV